MFLDRLRKLHSTTLLILSFVVATCPGCAAQDKPKDPPKEQSKDQDPPKEQSKQKPSKEEVFSPAYIKRFSEAYGHYVYTSLSNPLFSLDFNAVIQGMKDGKAGKPSPMTEQQFEEAASLIQEYAFQENAARNLKEAEEFLKKNAKAVGVVEVEPGKLQYLVLQKGTGEEVTDNNMPVIGFTGKYLNGEVFTSSEENGGPIPISLNQTIPGFRKGILGMLQGEKRRLFIHPDLGYGTAGQLQPNALLIFDIEVTGIKPKEEKKDTDPAAQDDDNDDDDVSAVTYGDTQSPADKAQGGEDTSSKTRGQK